MTRNGVLSIFWAGMLTFIELAHMIGASQALDKLGWATWRLLWRSGCFNTSGDSLGSRLFGAPGPWCPKSFWKWHEEFKNKRRPARPWPCGWPPAHLVCYPTRPRTPSKNILKQAPQLSFQLCSSATVTLRPTPAFMRFATGLGDLSIAPPSCPLRPRPRARTLALPARAPQQAVARGTFIPLTFQTTFEVWECSWSRNRPTKWPVTGCLAFWLCSWQSLKEAKSYRL